MNDRRFRFVQANLRAMLNLMPFFKTIVLKAQTLRRHHTFKPFNGYVRIIVLLTLLLIIFIYNSEFLFESRSLYAMELYKDFREEGSDPQQTCQLPVYHPFEHEVLPYFSAPRPIRCRSRVSSLTYMDGDGFLRYNLTAFSESGYDLYSLKCAYQEIYRVKGNDDEIYYGEETPTTGYDKPKSDFIYVTCRRFPFFPNVYSMYHAFAQKKSHIRRFRDDTEVGVAVVGLDSVSRLNFMRQLPKSYNLITSVFDGILMKGFNKIGENTFPNLIAILTGNEHKPKGPESTFDDWPFIWSKLRKDNIATLYGEDCTSIMTFSWWGNGFHSSPTTHYFRPFWVAVDKSPLSALSSSLCLGPVPKHRLYLEYLKSFLRSYRHNPIFMFSLENEPSHDYLNTVGVIDDDLKEFLLSSFNEHLFNRTVLFILSDHGQRFDEFRNTKQGKAEDRMPIVSIVLPKWFSQLNPHIIEALKTNSRRLTSSFDIYSTFVDIFRGDTATEKSDSHDAKKSTWYNFEISNYGVSLFQHVPSNRTCKDAGIPEMYCICTEDTRKLQKDDEIVWASIEIMGNYINNEILEGTSSKWNATLRSSLQSGSNATLNLDLSLLKKCAKLTFNVENSEVVVKSNGRQLIHLIFSTQPNGGIFEGRVMWWRRNGLRYGSIEEEIIRINRYYNQADCLDRMLMTLLPLVRSVCYCV